MTNPARAQALKDWTGTINSRRENKLSLTDIELTRDPLSIAREEAARKLAPRKPAPRKAFEAPKPARRGFFARLFNI